jgi:hypothetical protein
VTNASLRCLKDLCSIAPKNREAVFGYAIRLLLRGYTDTEVIAALGMFCSTTEWDARKLLDCLARAGVIVRKSPDAPRPPPAPQELLLTIR